MDGARPDDGEDMEKQGTSTTFYFKKETVKRCVFFKSIPVAGLQVN